MMPALPPLQRLVPLAHVASVARSIDFYRHVGFEPVQTMTSPRFGDEPHWAFLRGGGAELMLALADAPVHSHEQGILFYLYVDDVIALHTALQRLGLPVGPIQHPDHMPEGEFRLADPDGYVTLVGQPSRGA